MLDYNADRHCPVYNRIIDCDLCYDSICSLARIIKISSTPELLEVKDIENARKICNECPYSDFGAGMEEWDGNTD